MLTINQLQRFTTIHDNFEILGYLEDLVTFISRYPEALDILESLIGTSDILRVEAEPVRDYEDIKLIVTHGVGKTTKVFEFIDLAFVVSHPNIEYKFLEMEENK